MKIEINPSKISTLLLFAFLTAGLVSNVSAQDDRRPRVIISNPVVRAQPSPTPIRSAQVTNPTKNSAYLKGRLNGILVNRLLKRGRVGVKVMSLATGKTIFERNADRYFMPASNMKSYSVAAAIDQLSPSFRFVTSVYANAKPDKGGTIRGNLIIYGRGDPSISTSFHDGDYYKGIDALAQKIAQAGVKRIEGSLVGDETYFNSKSIPFGWEWDDLQWYYGAEISPLTINNNSVDLKISPGAVGSSARVSILPANRQFRVINKTQTTPRGTKREIRVTKRLGENVLEITGKMPEKRSYYENMARERGYEPASSVTKELSLLVAADPSVSGGKLKKAAGLGVKVVSLDEWLNGDNVSVEDDDTTVVEEAITPEIKENDEPEQMTFGF